MPSQSSPDEGNGFDVWKKHILITQEQLVEKTDNIWRVISNQRKENSDEFTKLRAEVRNRVDKERTKLTDDIQDIKVCVARIDESMVTKTEVGKVKTDVSNLQLKSGLWGLLAGLIPTVGLILWAIVTGVFS